MIRKLALLLSLAGLPVSAQTAAEIVAKHIEARGGADKMAAIKSMRIEGRMKLATDDFAPFTVLASRPSNFRLEFNSKTRKIVQGYDGKTAWQDDAPATGAAKTQVLDQAIGAIGGPLVDYKERGIKVDFAGKEKWKSHDTLKLKVTLPTGTVMNVYLDPKSYLEVGEELYWKNNGVESLIEETVAGDKAFGGVLFPTKFESRLKGSDTGQVLEVQNIVVNPVIAASKFKLPAASPASVKKPAAAPKP